MAMELKSKVDIFQPLDRARRCLDLWLKEEKRFLPRPLRLRVSALIARYFQHEDAVNDQLILSFLRHYSGLKEIDIEDPAEVRMEIKSILDKSVVHVPHASGVVAVAVVAGIVLACLLFFGWHMSQKKITSEQVATLKTHVAQVSAREGVPQSAIWARVKKPLGVTRYQDISYWDYDHALEIAGVATSGPGM